MLFGDVYHTVYAGYCGMSGGIMGAAKLVGYKYERTRRSFTVVVSGFSDESHKVSFQTIDPLHCIQYIIRYSKGETPS